MNRDPIGAVSGAPQDLQIILFTDDTKVQSDKNAECNFCSEGFRTLGTWHSVIISLRYRSTNTENAFQRKIREVLPDNIVTLREWNKGKFWTVYLGNYYSIIVTNPLNFSVSNQSPMKLATQVSGMCIRQAILLLVLI